jgi:signal transduction histidine kinase
VGQLFKKRKKNFAGTSISVKLTRAIFITSTIVTLVISSMLFFADYTRDRRQVEGLYQSGKMSAVNSLVAAISKDDFLQIQLQADGLVFLPGIKYVKVKDLNGEGLATSGVDEKDLTNIRWIRWDIRGIVGGTEKFIGRIELAQDMTFLFMQTAEKAAIFYFGQFIKTLLTVFIFVYLIDRHVVRHLLKITEYFNNANGPEIAGDAKLKLERDEQPDELQFMVDIINKMHRLIWFRYADQRQKAINLDKELKRNAEANISGGAINALSELAAGVAHNINNPLAIIEGYLGLTSKQIQNPDFDRQKVTQLIESSRKSLNRISYVTRQLLNFASQGLGEPYVKTNMREVFDRFKAAISGLEKEVGMRAKLPDLDGLELIEIVCRKDQITQALLAFVKNSFDAVADLEQRWVEIKYSKDDLFHEFVITDSGKGLTKDMESKVFTAFYTTKMDHRNLGLGLTLAQGIAEAHRGKVTIDADSSTSTVRFVVARNLQVSTVPSANHSATTNEKPAA